MINKAGKFDYWPRKLKALSSKIYYMNMQFDTTKLKYSVIRKQST